MLASVSCDIEYSADRGEPSGACSSWVQGREPVGTVFSTRFGQSGGVIPAGSISSADISATEAVNEASAG